MSKVMERQPIQLGASNRRPKDARHEVLLPPDSASRRRENEVMGATVPRSQLCRRDLCRHDSQMHNPLSAGLRLSEGAGSGRPLDPHDTGGKIEVAPTETKHFALAQTG
jgi:hypothetical protein